MSSFLFPKLWADLDLHALANAPMTTPTIARFLAPEESKCEWCGKIDYCDDDDDLGVICAGCYGEWDWDDPPPA